jgi:alanyl-tRNA synthetase
VLAVVDSGKVALVAGASKGLAARLSAAELMQAVAPVVGAKGGGRPDLARAGGGDRADAVVEALDAARRWTEAKLSA